MQKNRSSIASALGRELCMSVSLSKKIQILFSLNNLSASVFYDENAAEYSRLKAIFENPSLQMASFTITEKGYSLVNGQGETLPAVEADMKNKSGFSDFSLKKE